MAFDFAGTFNKSQFDRFAAWARAQVGVINDRINHLSAEQSRIGSLVFNFDSGGMPIGFTASGLDTYIGKLCSAYEILGGDILFDLNVRSMNQPVFLLKTDEATPAQLMSNGEVVGAPGRADGDSSELMTQARTWLRPVHDYRKEYLERKIRRAMDYADSLQAEIDLLNLIQSDASIEDSFEFIAAAVGQLFSDPSYRAIWDDQAADPFGKLIYAPFLPYSSGNNRQANDIYGRDELGATKPGQKEQGP